MELICTYCREEMFLSACSLETKPRKFPRKTSYPARQASNHIFIAQSCSANCTYS